MFVLDKKVSAFFDGHLFFVVEDAVVALLALSVLLFRRFQSLEPHAKLLVEAPLADLQLLGRQQTLVLVLREVEDHEEGFDVEAGNGLERRHTMRGEAALGLVAI